MKGLNPIVRARKSAIAGLTRWSLRRHGADSLPLTVARRRIYILPSRFGAALGSMLAAMLLAGLNYSSNLGLAFAFLMTSLALVAMHHCHRNLLGMSLDMDIEADAIAGESAEFRLFLHNASNVERCDIEIRCASGAVTRSVAPVSHLPARLDFPVEHRGILRIPRIELRTRYPFGWFRAWTYVHRQFSVFVAPRPIGERPLPLACAVGSGIVASETRGDADFSGLRAYQPGEPLKHMAWKALARGGEPAVRSYTGVAGEPEWLDWSSLEGLDAEARLSQLCRWVLDSEALQQSYGLRLPGVEIAPSLGQLHRSACLRTLAEFPAPDTP